MVGARSWVEEPVRSAALFCNLVSYRHPVIAAILRATARHRRAVLTIGVVVAIAGAAAVSLSPSVGRRLFPALALVVGTLLILGLASWLQPRPAAFAVQPDVPAFGTPVRAGPVYQALCVLLAAAGLVCALVRSVRLGTSGALDFLFPAVSVLATALIVTEAWRGLGVQLRPDGVCAQYVLGSLTVPWEALPLGHTNRPADQPPTLRLVCARPELVRRRGRATRKTTLPTDNIDAQFLADAIRHYVLHPEHRAAIGTGAEYRRLLHALTDR